MTEVMIKPLRTYEDRGEIRRRGGKAYPAPMSLAKELVSLGLCTLGDSSAITESVPVPEAIKELGRGNWVLVDGNGVQVGDFSGTKKEAGEELARLIAPPKEPESDDPPPAAEPTAPVVEPSPPLPQE